MSDDFKSLCKDPSVHDPAALVQQAIEYESIAATEIQLTREQRLRFIRAATAMREAAAAR